MGKQMNNRSSSLIGLQQKNELLSIMDSLFPEQRLLDGNSVYRKKVEFTFELMQKQKWTVEEFKKVMLEFSMKWGYNYWMPANILEFRKKLFPETEMIL